MIIGTPPRSGKTYFMKIDMLLTGQIIDCKMYEIRNILRNINNLGINTLMIQQSIDKDIFYLKIKEESK